MRKKFVPVLLLLLLSLSAGCKATFTNLTPQRQPRRPDNQYTVEVALNSQQQTLRWQSIHPQIVVGNRLYPMTPTQLMTNRWEGVIPVPASSSEVKYHYQFDFEYNTFGKPKNDSTRSADYLLKIVD